MKQLRQCCRKALTIYLILAMLVLGCLPYDAMAVMIPSDLENAGVSIGMDRDADIQKIQMVLESKLVMQRLSDLGLSVEEVQQSMAKLTTQELHNVASNLDGLQAGGDLGLVIGILVVVVLVLLIIFLAKRA
ncbi:MAG TPA: PA2779 family protein [Nitrospirales bacterium]